MPYEVRNEQKWVLVLFGDLVKASEVNAKSKRAVFFPNEKNWSSMGRVRGMN